MTVHNFLTMFYMLQLSTDTPHFLTKNVAKGNSSFKLTQYTLVIPPTAYLQCFF
jgi:hypothetical protein